MEMWWFQVADIPTINVLKARQSHLQENKAFYVCIFLFVCYLFVVYKSI